MPSPRHRAILELCPRITPIIDVGSDHGLIATALGGIATERLPHRRSRAACRWIIADGLKPFRDVGTAVIAGMGARRIASILTPGPRPRALLLHAQDEPGWLRNWLAEHHWRIDAEALAPEGHGFAEVLRVLPGREEATGLPLFFGPRLLEGQSPHFQPWLEHHRATRRRILDAAPEGSPAHQRVSVELAFLHRFD